MLNVSNTPPPHIAIDIPEPPPAATPSGPQSKGEKVAAWVGAAGQQAVVSGSAWGFANKLPVAIGTTVGASIGGPAGAAAGVAVGAAVGNLIGGAALGITHYSAEVACNNARVKMGHGFQYQPDPGAGATKFTYNSFIGTFSTVGALKSMAKTGVDVAIGDGKDWAKAFAGVAVDTGSSMAGGAIAQTIINDRQHLVGENGFSSEIKYKELKDKKFDWDEATTRMKGGTAAGVSAGLLDASMALVQDPVKSGAKVAVGAMIGAVKTSIMLHTWFNARETFASPPKPAAPAPAPAAPPTGEANTASSSQVELSNQPGGSTHIDIPSLLTDTVDSKRYYGGEQSEIVSQHSNASNDETTPISSKRHETTTLESTFDQSSRGWERSRS